MDIKFLLDVLEQLAIPYRQAYLAGEGIVRFYFFPGKILRLVVSDNALRSVHLLG
jgi:hypothetical protein